MTGLLMRLAAFVSLTTLGSAFYALPYLTIQ